MAAIDDGGRHHVVWDSPSTGPAGSMPLGNGDVGINAWVQSDGELRFYIGKTDAWDGSGRLLKVGLVRIALAPNPFAPGALFRQELDLSRGQLLVTASHRHASHEELTLRLRVDANHPVVDVEIEAARPVSAFACFSVWRTANATPPAPETSDILRTPDPVEPDEVLTDLPEGIGWCHLNSRSRAPDTMRHQALERDGWTDPLLHRVFGSVIRGAGSTRLDGQTLRRPEATQHRFQVYVLTSHPADRKDWLSSMRSLIARIELLPAEERRAAHEAWWRGFWNRSSIDVRETASGSDTGADDVARGYLLQRFVNACGGRGAYPIKFNGSIFTVPNPGSAGDADYRRWGTGYWWQNTRLPYLAMCAAGDYELMEPLFRCYVDELLPVNTERARRYFGFEGTAYYPECVYFWGPVFTSTYGPTPARERQDKLQDGGWHKWEWVGGLELVYLMQDYYDHRGDERFLTGRLLPTALAVLRFLDRFWKVGADGKLAMHPSQALETWWDCTNPMPEVAGMRAVVDRLLALPPVAMSRDDRVYLEGLSRRIPELPVREQHGLRMLAPALSFADKKNVENPELYAVYPFRLVSFEKPNVDLGVQALNHRLDRGDSGWRQDDAFMAYLGMTEEARASLVRRARAWDRKMRFPAFWGPNYDWTPDQCHGGVLTIVLQSMLMQTEGRTIHLLPAWPASWDADFKLRAPYATTVQGSVRAGKLVELRVEPESRRKDVKVRGEVAAEDGEGS